MDVLPPPNPNVSVLPNFSFFVVVPLAMGACCAGLPTVKPEDVIPDPTEPSTFFLSKQSLLSSNYKVRAGWGRGCV